MSDDIREPRDMSVAVPLGWVAHETVELNATELGAHLIASVEPLRAGASLDDVSRAYGALLARTLPEYQELGLERTTPSGGRPIVIRQLGWTPPGGRPVAQLQIYDVDGANAYVATATVQAGRFERIAPRLRQLLLSLLVDRTSGVTVADVHEPTPADEAFAAFERGETFDIATPTVEDEAWDDCIRAWGATQARF